LICLKKLEKNSTFRVPIPARQAELLNAEEEGITCKFLALPTRFVRDDQVELKELN